MPLYHAGTAPWPILTLPGRKRSERPQPPGPPRRTFELDRRTYRLTRLSDGQDSQMRRSSIAINVDLPLELVVPRSDQLGLAETYAVCRHLFGERGRGFDRWKGGFAFPFALEVPGAARCPAYSHVMNYRSGLEYFLRKLVDPSDERLQNSIYYPPDAAEFPRAEIHRLVAFFVGFLEGYFQSLRLFWGRAFSVGRGIECDLVRLRRQGVLHVRFRVVRGI